ncbi:MAG: hypothetical protein OXC14_17255 [Rhodospirillaceae bacterium]|nr:hypothetical protein [Rhodospirillaceae bacterium]
METERLATEPACKTCTHWYPSSAGLGECGVSFPGGPNKTAPDDYCGQWVSRLFRGAPVPVRDEW